MSVHRELQNLIVSYITKNRHKNVVSLETQAIIRFENLFLSQS